MLEKSLDLYKIIRIFEDYWMTVCRLCIFWKYYRACKYLLMVYVHHCSLLPGETKWLVKCKSSHQYIKHFFPFLVRDHEKHSPFNSLSLLKRTLSNTGRFLKANVWRLKMAYLIRRVAFMVQIILHSFSFCKLNWIFNQKIISSQRSKIFRH